MNIKMANYLMEACRSGVKRVTIREGHRYEYRNGPCVIEDATNPNEQLAVDVHTLIFTTAERAPAQYVYADGFANVDHMIETLRKFYPNIDRNSKITIVAWERQLS